MNKKAQTNLAMVTSVISVVILLVAIGIIFSSGFKANSKLTDMAEDVVSAHANQTITWAGNNTGIQLAESRIIESTIIVYNNGSKISKGGTTGGNYSTSVASITPLNQTPVDTVGDSKGLGTGTWVTGKINVSYSYNIGSQERNITLQSNEGMKVVSDFQPTWALIIGIGILITAILLPLVIWIMNRI